MDASELATKMLEWEKNKRALDALGSEIEAEVLKLGKTQVVGKCRVTYSGGRATYDYETSGKFAPNEIIAMCTVPVQITDWEGVKATVPDVVAEFTHTENRVDYKTVCKEAKIEPLIVSKTEPTATIKLED